MGLGPAGDPCAQGVGVRHRRESVVACAPRLDAAAGGLGDELEREGPAVEDVSVGASRGPDGPSDAEARREGELAPRYAETISGNSLTVGE